MATRQPQWQVSNYSPYQFNHVAEFGIPSSERDPITRQERPQFSKIGDLHFARRNQTISDRFQAAGTSYQDTTMIVIRHNRDLSSRKVLYVKIDEKLYKVVSYSVNNDTFNAVDLLTLKHVEKVN